MAENADPRYKSATGLLRSTFAPTCGNSRRLQHSLRLFKSAAETPLLPSSLHSSSIRQSPALRESDIVARLRAEGVATEAQLQYLEKKGCPEMRNFLYSRAYSRARPAPACAAPYSARKTRLHHCTIETSCEQMASGKPGHSHVPALALAIHASQQGPRYAAAAASSQSAPQYASPRAIQQLLLFPVTKSAGHSTMISAAPSPISPQPRPVASFSVGNGEARTAWSGSVEGKCRQRRRQTKTLCPSSKTFAPAGAPAPRRLPTP
jgi:hypothetical protein